MPEAIRCPQCGHVVHSYFDHVDIKCEHDMTEEEIAALMQRATLAAQPPYGEMCRDPSACAGKGYCPRDPNCGD